VCVVLDVVSDIDVSVPVVVVCVVLVVHAAAKSVQQSPKVSQLSSHPHWWDESQSALHPIAAQVSMMVVVVSVGVAVVSVPVVVLVVHAAAKSVQQSPKVSQLSSHPHWWDESQSALHPMAAQVSMMVVVVSVGVAVVSVPVVVLVVHAAAKSVQQSPKVSQLSSQPHSWVESQGALHPIAAQVSMMVLVVAVAVVTDCDCLFSEEEHSSMYE
jgi:hypothetical protein